MDDLAGVSIGDCLADLLEHRDEIGRAARANGRVRARTRVITDTVRQDVGERLALDELHHEERATVGERADVVNGRDRGVLKLTGDARLVGAAAVGESTG